MSASKTIYFVTVLALTFFATGCKKYSQGGPVGKAEKNLKGEWDLEKAFKNGSAVTNVTANPQIGEVTEDWWFLKNNDVATEDGNSTLTGSWQLVNNNKSIQITIAKPSSKASTEVYEIKQLDKNNMAWEHQLNGDTYRYEFKLSSKETPASADEI